MENYEKFKELILSLDEKGLKELYQMCNMRYFELHINGNDEYAERYKELWISIGKELRKRGIWNY